MNYLTQNLEITIKSLIQRFDIENCSSSEVVKLMSILRKIIVSNNNDDTYLLIYEKCLDELNSRGTSIGTSEKDMIILVNELINTQELLSTINSNKIINKTYTDKDMTW